jgi:hypothetical protein
VEPTPSALAGALAALDPQEALLSCAFEAAAGPCAQEAGALRAQCALLVAPGAGEGARALLRSAASAELAGWSLLCSGGNGSDSAGLRGLVRRAVAEACERGGSGSGSGSGSGAGGGGGGGGGGRGGSAEQEGEPPLSAVEDVLQQCQEEARAGFAAVGEALRGLEEGSAWRSVAWELATDCQ